MFSRSNMNRFALTLAIMMALVAIAIPTCQMVGCDMGLMPSGAMPFMPDGGAYTDCPGEWVVNSGGQSGIIPSGIDSMTLTLLAGIVALAVFVLAPNVQVSRVQSYRTDPPPPPEDPLGMRFRV